VLEVLEALAQVHLLRVYLEAIQFLVTPQMQSHLLAVVKAHHRVIQPSPLVLAVLAVVVQLTIQVAPVQRLPEAQVIPLQHRHHKETMVVVVVDFSAFVLVSQLHMAVVVEAQVL
jgi:hypothetical protein